MVHSPVLALLVPCCFQCFMDGLFWIMGMKCSIDGNLFLGRHVVLVIAVIHVFLLLHQFIRSFIPFSITKLDVIILFVFFFSFLYFSIILSLTVVVVIINQVFSPPSSSPSSSSSQPPLLSCSGSSSSFSLPCGGLKALVPVGTGPPVGVGIGSLPVTPKINGEIGAMCVESDLAGVDQHNKT